MTTEPQKPKTHEGLILEFVRRHQIKIEALTEQQLAQAIEQAIACGDFVRNITQDSQSVTYTPFAELESVRTKYNELLLSVENKHEGETRHETALRYIREREWSGMSSETCGLDRKVT